MSTQSPILLEVPIASLEDALAAQAGGADRLELNSALAMGGLTPSPGLLLEVRQAVQLPIIVMVRPRPGGFAYSAADFRVLQRDLDWLLEQGADGCAVGVLRADGRIDADRCRLLLRQAGKRPLIFHRAFDVTPEPLRALEQLIDLGVQRLMTSGQEESAYNGTSLIAKLREIAAQRIEILPAGGINRFNVQDVLTRTGCTQIHASLRGKCRDTSVAHRPNITFGRPGNLSEDSYDSTSQEAVAELKQRCQPC